MKTLKRPEPRGSQRRGQATVEYAALSTILLIGLLGSPVVFPVTTLLIEALQDYVDFMLYAFNLAVG